MKVRISYKTDQWDVDQEVEGKDCEEIVAAMKRELATHLTFGLRLLVNAMSPLAFAQEATKRYAAATKKNLPVPKSCEDFIHIAEDEGIMAVVE